ncbi:MAG: Gfo/Idh/MocA family oxidoreductase [Chloroflexi bacterium]|nr:Gfo/Idh/MocA family oxidoreductase [Chloroflexota bacterium]
MNVAILGAGTMGTIHGLCLRQIPAASVTAVWSRNYASAEKLARTLETKAYDTIEAAIGTAEVIDICLATPMHQAAVLQAATMGRHVICEKPLALSLAAADEMISACRKAGVHLYPAQVVRFWPEFVQLRNQILTGAIGRPAVVRTSRCSTYPQGVDSWHNNPELSGGVVLDLMIHDLDWLLWTLGTVKRVYAHSLTDSNLPGIDYALATLRFANEIQATEPDGQSGEISGTIAQVEGSWAEVSGFRTHGEIRGDQGMLTWDSADSTPFQMTQRNPPRSSPEVSVPNPFMSTSPYQLELEHFLQCIGGQATPIVTAADGRAALQLSLAVMESARTGQPVTILNQE